MLLPRVSGQGKYITLLYKSQAAQGSEKPLRLIGSGSRILFTVAHLQSGPEITVRQYYRGSGETRRTKFGPTTKLWLPIGGQFCVVAAKGSSLQPRIAFVFLGLFSFLLLVGDFYYDFCTLGRCVENDLLVNMSM